MASRLPCPQCGTLYAQDAQCLGCGCRFAPASPSPVAARKPEQYAPDEMCTRCYGVLLPAAQFDTSGMAWTCRRRCCLAAFRPRCSRSVCTALFRKRRIRSAVLPAATSSAAEHTDGRAIFWGLETNGGWLRYKKI